MEAQNNGSMENWDKEMLRKWLERYENYMTKYAEYIEMNFNETMELEFVN